MTNICIECGKCRVRCPIYLVLRNESASPRTKGKLENNRILDKIFYLCSLCDGYKSVCPIKKLNLNIIGAREKLVKEGIELPKNKEMIKNLEECGNPFGIRD
ncbi:MAG: 4Fe-4S dicluster domain-containing protein [Nanoarchaeota archaeon]|nr:4Fe-4S dicluster domain-containing protein [Nanoarchaeota archaeon]